MIHFQAVFTFLLCSYQIQCEATLQRKLKTELKINTLVENHMEQLATVLTKVESEVDKLVLSKWSHMDKADYVGTPLTAMVMVRRLVREWSPLATLVGRFTSLRQLQLGDVRWPSVTDFEASARSVMRSLLASDMGTDLQVRGDQRNSLITNVTATDCFEIAHQYMEKDIFPKAKEWLQYALLEVQDSDNVHFREKVLYYLAAALCFSDDASSSKHILSSILKENRHSKPPEDLADLYRIMGTQGCLYTDEEVENQLFKMHWQKGNEISVLNFYHKNDEAEHHSRLCRGEGNKIDSRLRCRYVHYHQPHLMFQPFKLEELQLDSPVVRFYDLVSDKEAESIMNAAKDKMARATVGSFGQQRYTEYRTSQNYWLVPEDSLWLDRRISEATSLDTTYAEQHQVARYSVSGEYLPHKDYFGAREVEHWVQERIATLMFYLNDVELGGSTVFTQWNLTVPAVKNSAVLWFNYLPSGEGDELSTHSGCPVLKGTKWVLNKWFHNAGNDVTFPCRLDRNGSFEGFYL